MAVDVDTRPTDTLGRHQRLGTVDQLDVTLAPLQSTIEDNGGWREGSFPDGDGIGCGLLALWRIEVPKRSAPCSCRALESPAPVQRRRTGTKTPDMPGPVGRADGSSSPADGPTGTIAGLASLITMPRPVSPSAIRNAIYQPSLVVLRTPASWA